MWSQFNTKHCKLLIIKLSFPWLFKQRMNYTESEQTTFTSSITGFSLSLFKNSHYNQWSCLHYETNVFLTWYIHLLFCLWWVLARVQNSKLRCFSDDSPEHLWLAVAFISSTESRVIGCSATLSTHLKRNVLQQDLIQIECRTLLIEFSLYSQQP